MTMIPSCITRKTEQEAMTYASGKSNLGQKHVSISSGAKQLSSETGQTECLCTEKNPFLNHIIQKWVEML